ncbi:hypothetical protein EON81_21370 [bacterium]|nr:MAG: hypothetical protein EON81_21370 [bacterium]
MSRFKEGDKVRVVTRKVTDADRKANRYFDHMAGLLGEVENAYAEECAVRVDVTSLSDITRDVHQTATRRMREKFVGTVGDEQRKSLTKEELEFTPNYVLLVAEKDLEPVA